MSFWTNSGFPPTKSGFPPTKRAVSYQNLNSVQRHHAQNLLYRLQHSNRTPEILQPRIRKVEAFLLALKLSEQ